MTGRLPKNLRRREALERQSQPPVGFVVEPAGPRCQHCGDPADDDDQVCEDCAPIQALARIQRANAADRRHDRRERPACLDIEEANRRDARLAGELASPPASTDVMAGASRWPS